MIPTPPAGIGPAVVEAFLAGRTPTTLRAYRNDLHDFAGFVATPTPQEAVATLLGHGHGAANGLALRYRADLLARSLAPATVNRRLAALRSLTRLARVLGLIAWELEVANMRSAPYRDTRGPGREGVAALFAALDTLPDTPLLRRDRAALHLLYDLGLRRGEVVALDTADLDFATCALFVVAKGQREKTLLSLPPPTVQALAAWVAVRGAHDGPLFTNFDRAAKGDGRLTGNYLYKMVRARGRAAGVPVAPHGLRHTAITEACKAAQSAGMGLEEVLDFSRHKDVRVLMIYRDRERNVQGTLAALVAAREGV